jgi:hypothetical protein
MLAPLLDDTVVERSTRGRLSRRVETLVRG